MSLKSKLIASISAFCLIVATLCVGAWAMQVQTTDWGGDINFTASYISATISKATLSGVSHVNSADSSNKMQAVTLNSKTTTETLQADENFNSWTNLKLKLTNSTGAGSISFTITNTHTNLDEYIDVNYDVTSAMQDNMEIWVTQTGSLVIAPNATSTEFTVHFKVIDKEIDANIFDFGINFDLKRILPTPESQLQTGLSWNVINTTEAYINGCESSGAVTVPALIKRASDGQIFPVTSVWFEQSRCESLNLPNTLTAVGVDSFAYCDNLKEFIMPNSVTYWGDALYGCEKLEYVKFSSNLTEFAEGYATVSNPSLKRIDLPMGLTSIGANAFLGNSSLESIYIPSSVTSIGESAFKGCGFTAIELPSSITTIGERAFRSNPLKEVVVPDSVTSIGKGCFLECNSLEKITIPFVGDGNGYNEYRLEHLFCSDYDYDNRAVPSSLKSVVVTGKSKADYYYANSIVDWAFRGCSSIEEIILGQGIKDIGEGAFRACTSLRNLVLPDELEYISHDCFLDCSSLETLIIPDSVTEIGNFYMASGLKKLVVSKNVTEIGEGFLQGCVNLESLTLPVIPSIYDHGDATTYYALGFAFSTKMESRLGPDEGPAWNFECLPASLKEVTITNTTNIGAQSFGSCQYIETINLPEGLKTIGNMAFLQCKSLKEVTLPNTLKTLGNYLFTNCYSLTSLNLPDGLTTLGTASLADCGLMSIEIPDSVTSMGSWQFSACYNLESVKLSKNVSLWKAGIFHNCISLTTVTIPSAVQQISSYTFGGCSNLTTIIMLSSAPPTLSSTAFTGLNESSNKFASGLKIIVPYGSEGAYVASWSIAANYIC